jgi:hypothetical protein
LEYRTGYIADEVSLPKIWTPKGFSENIAGYVGLNNMAVPARARLDIVETAASNLPVLILDQRGSGPLLEMRSNMDDVKLIVDLQGNVGIGTSVARTKLEVAGHVWPSSNLAYDLGSSNLRWRDLYLSGNTIDLGGTFLTRNAEGGGIKITSDSGEDVDTSSRNVNASGYVNINGTRLERHVTGPLMVKTGAGEGVMESGMFKHVYVDGTVRASNLEILGDFVTLNTVTSNTEQMVIVNAGTGPALKVTQTGANSIAEFYDDGNVLAFKVADGGNVGIGTSNPLAKLHVIGAIKATTSINSDTQFLGQASDSASAPSFSFTTNTNTGIFRPTANTFAISTGGSERMRVDSVGNVGIGTALPSTKVDIIGQVRIENPSAYSCIFRCNYPNSYGWKLKTIDRGSGIDLDIIGTNGLDAETDVLSLSIGASGRVPRWNGRALYHEGNAGPITIVSSINVNIAANTWYAIANLETYLGTYILQVGWGDGYVSGGAQYFWNGFASGVISLGNGEIYNSAPEEILNMNYTSHHRNNENFTFKLDSDNSVGAYGAQTLYIRHPLAMTVTSISVKMRYMI